MLSPLSICLWIDVLGQCIAYSSTCPSENWTSYNLESIIVLECARSIGLHWASCFWIMACAGTNTSPLVRSISAKIITSCDSDVKSAISDFFCFWFIRLVNIRKSFLKNIRLLCTYYFWFDSIIQLLDCLLDSFRQLIILGEWLISRTYNDTATFW